MMDKHKKSKEDLSAMKSFTLKQVILFLYPMVILIPVPFLARYKFSPFIIGGYIIFAAIFGFALYYILF